MGRRRGKKEIVVQPCIIHSSPFNWCHFKDYYRQMELTTLGSYPEHKIKLNSYYTFYHNDVGWSRSFCAAYSMRLGATHTLFLDSDNIHAPDTVIRLLSHKKHIVSGLYFTHGQTNDPKPLNVSPVMYRQVGREGDHRLYQSISDFDPSKLIECDAVGAGCLLIDNSIFRKLNKHIKPVTGLRDVKRSGITSMRMYFQTTPFCTEDFTFCQYAREKLNEKIYVDPQCLSPHLTETAVNVNEFIFSKRVAVTEEKDVEFCNSLNDVALLKYKLGEKKK